MKLLTSISIGAVLLSASLQAGACTCGREPAKQALRYADVAFRGELIEHRGGAAVFRVDEVWKGDLGKTVEFEWRDGSHGDCNGFWPQFLKVGNKLLVFGTSDSHGFYRTSICLPTRFVSDVAEDLKELGPGKPPRKD